MAKSRDLRANTGRYENISYEERICLVCNTTVENELNFYFLFECCQYNSVREIYIPKYYFTSLIMISLKNNLRRKPQSYCYMYASLL